MEAASIVQSAPSSLTTRTKQIITQSLSDNATLLPSENVTISLNVISAAKILLQSIDKKNSNDLLVRLEKCLSTKVKLQFNTTAKEKSTDKVALTQDQIKFRKQMKRLRLAQLERSYVGTIIIYAHTLKKVLDVAPSFVSLTLSYFLSNNDISVVSHTRSLKPTSMSSMTGIRMNVCI